MSLESDVDIERYFELRAIGRQADALDLYNNKITGKYPDTGQRTLLIRYFRSHDPRFQLILRDNLVNLAERIIARTTYIISLLTKEIDTVDLSDAYSVIKMVEGLLSVISPDRYVAIAFAEKYVRYAKSLDFRHPQMERTAELIRLYVTDTIESVQEFKKEKEEKRKQHANRQIQNKKQQANFDLSKIIFSQTDIDKILISNTITRTEDIVISYCLKYWYLINDPAFEKTVFLFSRKYRTHNHDIFQAIKNGRLHSWKDEEILNAVLANVVTGYYYNISGDLYIQRIWARLKASAQMTEIPTTVPEITRRVSVKRKKRPAIVRPPKVQKPVIPFKQKKTELHKPVPHLPRAPLFVPNSIADMIKKLTGKTYTVYKDLFFKSIRQSIRNTLTSAINRKGTMFDDKQNKAEDIVYAFLFAHYNDPYQKWNDTTEQKAVQELGFHIQAIEPIITSWVKNNQ